MWTVENGRVVYRPNISKQRSALGAGYVQDVVTLIEQEGAK